MRVIEVIMTDNWLAKTVERLRHQGTDDAEVEVKECSKELSRAVRLAVETLP